ncbi:MAG: hypothetical protein GY855_09265, partial [candidate division Zixibacteria bacterium]|nr:hypothetical protein [candidate division Zixibacteria bacterium]
KKNSTGQFKEVNKIMASDKQQNDYFGRSVFISDEYIIVGADNEDTGGSNAGAAYIFKKNLAGQFQEVNKIQASDKEASDYFGKSVSISGEYAIVGAYYEDAGGSSAGAAYIFKKNLTTGQFQEVNKIMASDKAADDNFGISVSISGEYVMVGAHGEDRGGSYAGAAYIFKKNSTGQFQEVNKIMASDKEAGDYFGWSVSISGEYAIVGAHGEAAGGTNAGAAYVFGRSEIDSVIDSQYTSAGENWSVVVTPGYNSENGAGVLSNNITILGPVIDEVVLNSTTEMNWSWENLTVYPANITPSNSNFSYRWYKDGEEFVADSEEVGKIMAGDIEAGDYFGQSVSISGEYAIVGAYGEDTGGSYAGAAYIFKKNSTTGQFQEVNKIQASDKQADVHFGNSVFISGEYAIVGAHAEDTGGTNIGAAYIFKKNSTTGQFQEVNKIMASDKQASDYFGSSVSISNDYAIIGARYEDAGGSSAGAAYIFKKNLTTGQFQEVNKIMASDKQADDEFGYSVSISGDYAIVGAKDEDTGGSDAGAVYIFKKDLTGQFQEVNKIMASDKAASDYFGYSVSISDEYAIVGAYGEDTGGSSAGAVYIFKKDLAGQFQEVSKIMASDKQASDIFGYSVSISGEYAIVGAYGEDAGGSRAGAAYIFKKNSAGQFQEVNKIIASDSQVDDYFGRSVSISDGYAIVGANGEDMGGSSAGAAYIFDKFETGPTLDSQYTSVGENWKAEVIPSYNGEIGNGFFSNNITISGTVVGEVVLNSTTGMNWIWENLTAYPMNITPNSSNLSYQWYKDGEEFVLDSEEVGKIMADDNETDDFFGYSVSISGEYAIIGAHGEDAGGSMAGAAYIFKKNLTTGQFQEVNKIMASDSQVNDFFGYSVSISGEYAIVGAYLEDTGGSDAGSAYIFKKNSTTGQFQEVNRIMASDKQASDIFGYSVSISGEYAIVGAYQEDAGGSNAGAAYIFKKNLTGQFQEVDKIMASDKAANDNFGYSVFISDEYAIVGAYGEDTGGSSAGSAYIFKKNPVGQFQEVNKIQASDKAASDNFGYSVSISGEYAIVGANAEDTGGTDAGAAYIFKKNLTGQFQEVNKIQASDKAASDVFGNSVSISGEYAIVGANYEDAGGSDAGAAYIFKKNSAGQFQEVNKIMASDKEANDEFGHSVSISGEYV